MTQVLITITVPDGVEVDVRTVDPRSAQTPAAPMAEPPWPGGAQRPPQSFPEAMEAGAERAAQGCPQHGTAKLKQNSKGTYCASRLQNGQWCPWQP